MADNSVPDSIGLALSGGGFRATLFHLGVIRCLRDNGYLEKTKYITAVSGGSVLAGHLILHWDKYTGSDNLFEEAARDLLTLLDFDLRGRVGRRLPFIWTLGHLLPAPWALRSSTTLLEYYLNRKLFHKKTLRSVGGAERPALYLLATNATRGCKTAFSQKEITLDDADRIDVGTCSLAFAVAASAAFPGFFNPIKLTKGKIGAKSKELSQPEFLTDGGVFDNLGLHHLEQVAKQSPVDLKIVSNARGHFDWQVKRRFSILSNALRSTDIMMERIRELEFQHAKALDDADQKLKLLNIFEVLEGSQHTPPPEVQKPLADIRTDFDRFSKQEIDLLVRHGYGVARKTLDLDPAPDAWSPVKTRKAPDAEQADAVKDADKMRKAAFRKLRLFDLRDWLSRCEALLALLLVYALLGFQWPSLMPKGAVRAWYEQPHLFPYRVVSAPNDATGYWEGDIRWTQEFATNLVGQIALGADTYSKGEMLIVRNNRQELRAFSYWELYSGEQLKLSHLAVRPENIKVDQDGYIEGLEMRTAVREKLSDAFIYKKFTFYRVVFDVRNAGEMKGRMQREDEETHKFEDVGKIALKKR